MSKMYTETLEIRACQCDMCGAWKPSAILERMQETAGEHSFQLGLGRETMDSLGIAWVVTRLKVEFARLPHSGEKVTIQTYPTPNKHMFYPRSHVFFDETGAEIGRGCTLWVTMDLESRKIVRNEFVLSHMPDNRDLQMAAAMPVSVRPFDGEARINCVVPQYTDLDQNIHVNNTKYLDWCCNAIGFDIMKDNCLTAFDVNYDAEIRLGSEIRTELTMKDGEIAFCGFEGDKRHFGIRGRLSPRG